MASDASGVPSKKRKKSKALLEAQSFTGRDMLNEPLQRKAVRRLATVTARSGRGAGRSRRDPASQGARRGARGRIGASARAPSSSERRRPLAPACISQLLRPVQLLAAKCH